MPHTPAPWKVNESDFLVYVEGSEEDYCICSVQALRTNSIPSPEIAISNAHLIAAAPELLEALIELIPIIVVTFPQQQETWLANARAAIAKAKGKS